MAKIVYNACFGGFGLSDKGLRLYNTLAGTNHDYLMDVERDDPHLVRVVEELGKEASDYYANLQLAEVAAGTQWRIVEYDGNECVQTPEDIEWNVAKD